MNAYCANCGTQPASFRPGKDASTGAPFEDLCCDKCHLVLATVSEREAPGGRHEAAGNVVNMGDHLAKTCTCGSIRFYLLVSRGVECAQCGAGFPATWLWDSEAKRIGPDAWQAAQKLPE